MKRDDKFSSSHYNSTKNQDEFISPKTSVKAKNQDELIFPKTSVKATNLTHSRKDHYIHTNKFLILSENYHDDNINHQITSHHNEEKTNSTPPIKKIYTRMDKSRNTSLKVVPGNTSYCHVTSRGKNVTIFGDNIISNIKRKEFNKYIKGNAQIKSFSGATTYDMDMYVQPTLQKKVTDVAVIHVGTNDIGFNGTESTSLSDIADSIIKVGKRCRQSGINDVLVVNRNHEHIQKKVNELNSILESKCVDNDLILIDNSNILSNDICRDNIHLNFNGTCKLADNIIRHINFIDSSSA